jgi:nucleoid DNA-binding protein
VRLERYIHELLYRHECVIVPGFGGFVTQQVPARIDKNTHTFYPPAKLLSFNAQLTRNDGLLINYIAEAEHLSYDRAQAYLEKEVRQWNQVIAQEVFELERIGSFSRNREGQLVFDPDENSNYLTASFGLNTFVSPEVKRVAYKEQVRKLPPVIPAEETVSRTPAFIKYAAAAVIVFALGTIGWKEYQNFEYNKLLVQAEQQQQAVERSIQEATFVISNPLPAITLDVVKETFNYHIIAGAFREPANAHKKFDQLKRKGFDARILKPNKWSLTPVAYQSFNSRSEALQRLREIKQSESADAWLLVKEE